MVKPASHAWWWPSPRYASAPRRQKSRTVPMRSGRSSGGCSPNRVRIWRPNRKMFAVDQKYTGLICTPGPAARPTMLSTDSFASMASMISGHRR